MISYKPFYKTLKKRGVSLYLLTCMGISSRVLYYIKHNKNISMVNLNKLCLLLDCTPNDIFEVIYTSKEGEELKSGFISTHRYDTHDKLLSSDIKMKEIADRL